MKKIVNIFTELSVPALRYGIEKTFKSGCPVYPRPINPTGLTVLNVGGFLASDEFIERFRSWRLQREKEGQRLYIVCENTDRGIFCSWAIPAELTKNYQWTGKKLIKL